MAQYKYKNYGQSDKEYYEVTFAPEAEATVSGYINDSELIRVFDAATELARTVVFTEVFLIKYVDDDGVTVLRTSKETKGTLASQLTPPTPTKPATAQYTYTFSGWTPTLADVTGDATYKATYISTVNTYVITFVDYDGSEISKSTLMYGTVPTPPNDPTREGYTFTGWSPEVTAVTGDATYRATYVEN